MFASLTSWLYAYPAWFLAGWTLLCFCYLRLAPYASTIPAVVDWHPMANMLNIEAEYLTVRPGLVSLGLSLLISALPVLNLAFLALTLRVMALHVTRGHWRDEAA